MKKRPRRKKKTSWYLIWIFTFSIFAGCVATAFLLPSYWKVKRVNVIGTASLDKEVVLEIAKPAFNKNIFLINLSGLKSELNKIPMIAEVKIHHQFPDSLLIEINEKKEAAVAVMAEKTIYFDDNGVVLNPDGQPFNHQDVSGFAQLPVVVGLKAEDVQGGALEERIKNLLTAVLKDFKTILAKENIKIDFSRKDEIILLVDDFLSVKIGEPVEIERKMAVFKKLRSFEEKRLHSIEYVDVRLPENPAIKFK